MRIWFTLLLVPLSVCLMAQTPVLPSVFDEWLMTPSMSHATVVLEVSRIDAQTGRLTPLFRHDPHRFVAPASLLKLVTTGAALRLLGGSYVLPDSALVVDTTLHVPQGLEGYNPDWLIEDVGEDYAPPLTNQLPDSGRLLRDVVYDINHQSLNNQAETLLHLLTPSCRLDSGLVMVRNYWQRCGLDVEALRIYDGCGLAPSDRLTAHFLTTLLYELRGDADFVRSLPVAGQEGTVATFLRDTPLDGRARLKSGTLKTSLGYAGYVTGSDGATYIVTLIVNNYSSPPYIVRRNMQRVLLALIP